jgi:hypothetical protein
MNRSALNRLIPNAAVLLLGSGIYCRTALPELTLYRKLFTTAERYGLVHNNPEWIVHEYYI